MTDAAALVLGLLFGGMREDARALGYTAETLDAVTGELVLRHDDGRRVIITVREEPAA